MTAVGALCLILVASGVWITRGMLEPKPPKVEVAPWNPPSVENDRLRLPETTASETASKPANKTASATEPVDEPPVDEPPAEEPAPPSVSPKGSGVTPTISSDGRFVVFRTWIPGEQPQNNGSPGPAFLYDRTTESTEVVSISPQGKVVDVMGAEISGNGKYVAFLGAEDGQVYLRDLVQGTTGLISATPAGKPSGGGSAWRPTISFDGKYIAYESSATNLVANDTNGNVDVFVRDVAKGKTIRVSLSSAGEQASGWEAMISGNGRFVAFVSDSNVLYQGTVAGCPCVEGYVHDLETGQTLMVPRPGPGDPSEWGVQWPTLSDDGRYVTFAVQAKEPSTQSKVRVLFIHDRIEGTTEEIQAAEDGMQPQLSGDGDVIGYWGANWELTVTYLATGQTQALQEFSGDYMDFSGDHRYLTAVNSNGRVVVVDLQGGNREIIN